MIMEDVKKMMGIFKSEKCWDPDINIKDSHITIKKYKIYKIPKSDERDNYIFTYYLNEPKIKYYCWRECYHNGSHWDEIRKTKELTEDEKEKIDYEIYKILKSVVKKSVEKKVVDIIVDMYIDKKIKELT